MSEDTAVSTEAEEREPGSTHTSAHELGDITAQRLQGGLRKLAQTVGTEGDGVDYYRFTLSEAREVRLGLKLRQGEAELSVEDAEGNVLARSMAYAGYEAAVRTLLPGTYYVRVEAVGAAASEYEFRYGVLEANASFRPASDSPWHTGLAERMGMPSFGEAGYGFELSETVDGRVSGVLLGRVLAVDPNGEELSYRIVGGNGSGLFALGGASGELSYVGAGEDFEGGAGSYELTIRVSDGTHTIDTTVTVTITDAAEAPVFGEGSYAFALTENVDGSVSRVLLGVVEATDPDGDAVRYSLLGGNDSSLFAIEETSGELFYVGAGEDFEGGVTSYELTVRASDGTHTIDTTVTVTVTDAAEQPAFGEESYAFELAENADGRANGLSLGRVLATDPDGDEVRYSLTGGNESMLFNIDAASGELYYVGPGEDYESGVTSYELTVRASDAAHTVDTTVMVTVTDEGEAPAFGEESYAFELAENVDGRVNRLSLGTVTATDPDSDTVRYSLVGGNDSSLFAINETSGELFYVGAGEDFEGGVTSYELTVRASDAAHTVDTTVMVTVTDEAEAPAFGEESYAFELAENVDGRVNRLSLGTVTATDPDSDTVRYSLVGGNDSSLFAIEETSGELFYVGPGEDYESGVTSYEVTVRASDAAHTVDTTVTVTVTDAAEAPAFGEESYAFELAENVDGRVNWISLGAVTATDPDSDAVRYSLLDGNDSSLFAIEETSGELFYVGAGEDFEGGVTSYELTVRASDAAHTVDTTVTVTVTDAAEAPAFGEESYAFELAENVDGRVNRLSLGTVTATDPDSDTVRYSLLVGNDSSLFGIEETSGELFYVGAGEDFEGGVTSYELTVRASDAAHTVDTTVMVTVTDEAEAPAFGEESYAFELAENVDGRVNRLSLGAVTATDPDSDTVRYSLLGGNDSSLFAIEETSGELFYVGAGEDFEGGVTSYELTVRASDAAHTVDTTVTVTVTDAAEAPAFGEESYAFELAENVDGRVNRLSLGAVTATDPDSDSVRYSLLGGNDSSLFAIEETSGELFYVGAGEDFESGVTSHELTVRASDAAHTVDTTVTVTVTDAAEQPAFGEESYAFELAENADGRANGLSLGRVLATDPDGDEVRYSLTGGNESMLFNIDETSGELYYVGPGEDYESGVTSYELTVRASDAAHTVDTTVTVTVTDEGEAPAFGEESYAFELAENVDGRVNRLSLGTVTATDPDSDTVRYSLLGGNDSSLFGIEETSGELFYVGAGEDFEGGVTSYELTIRASDGTHTIDTTVTVTVTDAAEQPAFGDGSYAFELAENADGRANGLSLGRVLATDPDGDEVRYSLTGGNESMLFTVDETSGELYYVGPGEDYESGVTSYELTVRASDAAHTVDTTVTVTVTDAAEAPAFGEESYAFALAENADGRTERQSLGAVTATDPDGDEVRYSLAGGIESGLFAIGAASGELYYVGAGEDFESDAGPYELTVQASDGTHTVDAMVTVTVVDDPSDFEKSTEPQGSSEPAGEDLPAGRETNGEVRVNAEPVDGTLRSQSDRDWFAVTLAPGRTYAFNVEGDTPRGGTDRAPVIRGLRDANGDPVAGIVGGVEVRFTTDAAAAEAVYYIEVGGGGDSGQGSSATRGFGTRSSVVDTGSVVNTRGNSDGGSDYRLWASDITETRDTTDDYRSGVMTTGVVTEGGSVMGEIERAGDRDWFEVELVEGRLYRIDLEGGWTKAGTLSNAYLRGVYDRVGNLIDGTSNDNSGVGFNSRVYFMAPEAGTYYVAAGGYGGNEGTYTLSVRDVTDGVPDDFAPGTGTSGRVEVGGTATGKIEYEGDRDWFAVTLEAGRLYQIHLEGRDTGAGTLRNPYLPGVHDADGNLINGTRNNDSGEGKNSLAFLIPSEPATYYVAASAQGNEVGTYTLSVTDVTDDFAAGTWTSGTVEVGGTATGEINYLGERDWFAVILEAGKVYRIDLEGRDTGAGTLRDPYLRGVHGADGNLIDGTTNDNSDAGKNSRVFFTAPEDTTYYVAAGSRNTYEVGTYTLSVTEVVDDFASDTDTTGTVMVGDTATGEINSPGDRDWIAVILEAGKVYRIDLEGWDAGAGTLRDPYLRGVHDGDGNLIGGTTDNNGGAGRNSRVFFTAADADAPATYYVSAGVYGSAVGTYTLSVTEGVDDYAADTATTGTVLVGGTATGEIETSGDRDWIAVILEAGKVYRIDLEGWDTRAGTLRDPYLRGVHDGDGDLIGGTTDNNRGADRNSRVFFKAADADADATYYVSAGASGSSVGAYTLSVTEIVDDYAADTATTGTVLVGGTATGEINYPGDRDWIAVILEAGKIYRIDLEGLDAGAGTLRDPYLRGVHDGDGDLIGGTTDNNRGAGRNSRVFFTAPEDTTYYVSAGVSGFSLGTYTLSVTEILDDYAADTATTGTVLVGGTATGEINYSGERDWFAVILEAGKVYRIDLEGWDARAGTLGDPYLRGVHDGDGDLIGGTTDNNGGAGKNSRVFFTAADADADATYYVSAGVYGSAVGTYTLSVTETEIVDDYAADTATTGTVLVGGTATGEINYPGDRDWIAVILEAGKVYRIDLEGWDAGAGTLRDPYLRGVHDGDGDLIGGTTDNNSGADRNSRVFFTAADADADATYYVSAGASGSSEGTYTLSVTETEIVDDYAADTATTGTVLVGGTATGEINYPGDRDWIAVILEAGKIYRIDLEGLDAGAGTLRDPYLRGVHDGDGALIGGTTDNNRGAGRNSRVFFKAPEDTTYYVSAGASGFSLGTYTLSVTEILDDYAADTATTGTVLVGGTATGEINYSGDRDWIAVILEAGKVYRIDLEGLDAGAGTLGDPYLRGVHDGDGDLIGGTTDNNGGAGKNSRVFFTAADADANATYYVSAGVYGSAVGTYTLSVTEGVDDYAADTATTGTVLVGGTATGEIETSGDRDWIAVILEAGKVYRIDLEGWDTRAGTLRDPYLRGVHDGDGDLIGGTTDNNRGADRNSRVFFKAADADADATYYVSAGASGSSVGAYTLSVTEIVDDYAADTATTGTVLVGGTATGEINYPGDRDWIAVILEAGKVYRIDLEGLDAGAGTLRDPYLRGVHDGDGDLIGGTTDNNRGAGRNSRVFFTAADADADTTYYVSAGASGFSLGTYTLSVTEIVDDYAADTDTTGTVMVGSTATGEINYSGDRDWFAVILEAGKVYRIDLEGWDARAGTLGDPYLRGVHDGDGDLIGGTTDNNGGAGKNSRVFFTAADADADATYYVSAGVYGSAVGTYTLSVTEGVDDYAADTATTGTVMVGSTATGEIETSGDRDWFAVILEAGKVYRIDLEGWDARAGTLRDPYLRGVHDDEGILIDGTTNDNLGAGANSRVFFEAADADADATYYVSAGASGSSVGAYTLSVTEIVDDYASGTGTTGTVAVGGSATGEIDFYGDRDWLAVTLEADKTYRFDLEGSGTDRGTLSDPYLRGIHDADGNLIYGTTNDDGGTDYNSRVTFRATEPGIYYVSASAYEYFEGTYTLSVEEVTDGM